MDCLVDLNVGFSTAHFQKAGSTLHDRRNNVIPDHIPNWIDGKEQNALGLRKLDKLNPSTGKLLCTVSRSDADDAKLAIQSAQTAQPEWASVPPVQRGMLLHKIVTELQNCKDKMAAIVAKETGKSFNEALGETEGAIQLGLFFASEGQRLYGKTTTSGALNKYAMTIRQPVGISALIIAANTPIANVAWKVFPSMICGNGSVLKAAEDTPATAWFFGKIAHDAGLPKGVLNIVQGYGKEVGDALVRDPGVDLISFTGSTAVGRQIGEIAAGRMAKVSLELGGKNALVVCDDADLENAVKWSVLSSFSNAGQRCASSSRIVIFDQIYSEFRSALLKAVGELKVGSANEDDLGPVINGSQLENMLSAVQTAKNDGGEVLVGGDRIRTPEHAEGFYMSPTVIENIGSEQSISRTELFGPIVCLYKVSNYKEALNFVNDSPYGLTACIHTKNIDRAIHFTQNVKTGVAVINAGTYGSEPHMPFGGVKNSGNGTREPGTEAIDVYSDLKDIYVCIQDPITTA
jgi:aldehyde dehydrogenase (NAD+)